MRREDWVARERRVAREREAWRLECRRREAWEMVAVAVGSALLWLPLAWAVGRSLDGEGALWEVGDTGAPEIAEEVAYGFE